MKSSGGTTERAEKRDALAHPTQWSMGRNDAAASSAVGGEPGDRSRPAAREGGSGESTERLRKPRE
jgi:hypothetical protein